MHSNDIRSIDQSIHQSINGDRLKPEKKSKKELSIFSTKQTSEKTIDRRRSMISTSVNFSPFFMYHHHYHVHAYSCNYFIQNKEKNKCLNNFFSLGSSSISLYRYDWLIQKNNFSILFMFFSSVCFGIIVSIWFQFSVIHTDTDTHNPTFNNQSYMVNMKNDWYHRQIFDTE